MYSFRIDKKLINKAKKEAKKLGLCTSAFIRQAILEKINNQNKIKDIGKRLFIWWLCTLSQCDELPPSPPG